MSKSIKTSIGWREFDNEYIESARPVVFFLASFWCFNILSAYFRFQLFPIAIYIVGLIAIIHVIIALCYLDFKKPKEFQTV